MSLVTLEDINTWLLKYGYSYQYLVLDCSKEGDFGTHIVSKELIGETNVVLKIPLNIKVYGGGRVEVNPIEPTILYTTSATLYVLFNQENTTPLCYSYRLPYWMPLDNPNVLCLQGDLNHKLYFSHNAEIEEINFEPVQSDSKGDYITYNALKDRSELYVTSPDELEFEVYACNLQVIASAPTIQISPAFKGNENKLTDLITLPSEDIRYEVYYQGRKLDDSLVVPKDYEEDTIRIRVVTKSYEPYIGVDVYFDVPVETKALESIDDLNNYTYGYIDELSDVTGEINSSVHIIGDENSSISNANLTINAEVTFENISEITSSKIIVNESLEVSNSKLTPSNQFLFDNNGRLTIIECTSEEAQNLIINKATLNLLNNEFRFNSLRNYPAIHSENYPNLQGNTFNYTNPTEGYGICIIRTNEINTDDFLNNNTTHYESNYTNDNEEYLVTGNGIAYCQIDNDTITFSKLEVS